MSKLRDPDQPTLVALLEPKGLGNPVVFDLDSPHGWNRLFEEVRMHLEHIEDGQCICITRDRMSYSDFAHLPEHAGW